MKSLALIALMALLTIALAFAATDADGDGVSDTYDACPATPAGSTIVDPIENVDYAGCTCKQVKELLPEQNECVVIFCHETALTINMDAKAPQFVDCPADECDGVTLTDYPDDGYDRCKAGTWTTHSCEPVIEDCSLRCGCPENYTATSTDEPQTIVANVTEPIDDPIEQVNFPPRMPDIKAEDFDEMGQPLIIFLIPVLLLFLVGMLLMVSYLGRK